MGERKEYTSSNARIPFLTERINRVVDEKGGISEVSRLTGISRNTITFWCQGARTPDAGKMIAFCSTLDVSPNYLLGFDNTPTLNVEQRSAEKYTCLSADAIKKIHEYCPAQQSLTALCLSQILSSDSFYDTFMDAIIDVAASVMATKYISVPKPGLSYDDYRNIFNELDQSRLRLKVGAFDASQSVLTLLESVYHTSDISKKIKDGMHTARAFCDELEDNDGERG